MTEKHINFYHIKKVKKTIHNVSKALFSSSLKIYTLSYRMFGHIHEVLNIDLKK
jgi:hypothetical protein